MNALLTTLTRRGFIHQCTQTDGVTDAFRSGIVPVYAGFDATADSLHVGHLLPIMLLRRLQRAGHKPIVLIGGGTTRIGDPSFRSDSRPMLTDAQIATNIAGIRGVFERFLAFGDGATDAILVNNADWLDRLGYIDMLRDVGPHFSVNRMLSFDSVKSRLERQESLSFLEFNYMILQAYDFLELNRRYGCRLQIGGADQWGNIVSGIDLVRRMAGEEVFGLTAPLLTTASGAKMGKTAAGAVWLNGDRLSPYDYWQFWRNSEDRDVGRFLRLFTDLDEADIVHLESLEGADINAAKTVLADEATRLAHGEDARMRAAEAAAGAFGDGESLNGLPVIEVSGSVTVVDLLVQAGLVSSKSEARRLIANRGARLDDEVVEDEGAVITVNDPLKLSAGRKKHVLIRARE
nr:tyrosine--tRNA ligase [Asticcacaulis biprosthecium]